MRRLISRLLFASRRSRGRKHLGHPPEGLQPAACASPAHRAFAASPARPGLHPFRSLPAPVGWPNGERMRQPLRVWCALVVLVAAARCALAMPSPPLCSVPFSVSPSSSQRLFNQPPPPAATPHGLTAVLLGAVQ